MSRYLHMSRRIARLFMAARVQYDISKYRNEISDYLERLEDEPGEFDEYRDEYTKETLANMKKVGQQVQRAIKRVEDWHKTPITIVADSTFGFYDDPGPKSTAYVEVGSSDASFTVFTDKGTIRKIDDVLEAGEGWAFKSDEQREDYYSLLAELRKPGSSKKPGQVLTLYTARPVSDRRQYQNARKLPPNLFLTNDLRRAEGIAMDLSRGGKPRDVWKVRILDKYLTETLSTGRTKDYQITKSTPVPIKGMDLVYRGD